MSTHSTVAFKSSEKFTDALKRVPLTHKESSLPRCFQNSLFVLDFWQFDYNVPECLLLQGDAVWGLSAPCIRTSISLPRFGKFSAVISLNKVSAPFPFSPLSEGPRMHILDHFVMTHKCSGFARRSPLFLTSDWIIYNWQTLSLPTPSLQVRCWQALPLHFLCIHCIFQLQNFCLVLFKWLVSLGWTSCFAHVLYFWFCWVVWCSCSLLSFKTIVWICRQAIHRSSLLWVWLLGSCRMCQVSLISHAPVSLCWR